MGDYLFEIIFCIKTPNTPHNIKVDIQQDIRLMWGVGCFDAKSFFREGYP